MRPELEDILLCEVPKIRALLEALLDAERLRYSQEDRIAWKQKWDKDMETLSQANASLTEQLKS